MRAVLFLIFLVSLGFSGEVVTLRQAMESALQNSLEIKSSKREVMAQERELKSAIGYYFPRIKVEEVYTRTDIPVYAFMAKLNQSRITPFDFDPNKLNNPSAVNNFQTKFSIEVPIWMGGKTQAMVEASRHSLSATRLEASKKEEESLFKTYQAYADAFVAKKMVETAKTSLKEAEEHVRLAESTYKVGISLLADVLRAKVYLSKAQEMLSTAQNNYQIAKRGLELVTNTTFGDFDVEDLGQCPNVSLEELKQKALEERKDIKALQENIKAMKSMQMAILADNLPQVYAFGSYELNNKNSPFGSDGKGYMVGAGISWTFDTGLSVYNRYLAQGERIKAMEDRLKLLKDAAIFEVEKAYTNYLNSLQAYKSAQAREEASKETVRVMELRFRQGLVRMVDLLDAQTQLDMARFEKVQALGNCHKAYAELLYSAGLIREVLR
ncbi:TolC family protein [Thermocrinis minervae]|uniref:Outer membrane protein TolC n=1 Tax=Thermocrinis minervae TaxID=381751 RepID=A0A1M6QLD9_9AQUI|nr:TolC family protein [Thermocrinis minervae]SHK20873.1 Outer membrane protein TolC [Thermocrinis minervae]